MICLTFITRYRTARIRALYARAGDGRYPPAQTQKGEGRKAPAGTALRCAKGV
jgi:hypothetical protein